MPRGLVIASALHFLLSKPCFACVSNSSYAGTEETEAPLAITGNTFLPALQLVSSESIKDHNCLYGHQYRSRCWRSDRNLPVLRSGLRFLRFRRSRNSKECAAFLRKKKVQPRSPSDWSSGRAITKPSGLSDK
jgi:hypothetical protein